MAATLTAPLNAGTTYTTLSTTAMPQTAVTGEIMFVSQGLANVEPFVVSSPVGIGDLTVHVLSQQAAQNHLIGENVVPRYLLTAVGRTMSPVQTPRTHRL